MTCPKGNGITDHKSKESTAQWVQRAFVGTRVTVNTSCQEISSQEIYVVEELGKQSGQMQLGEGKLWCDQVEEHSEEKEGGLFEEDEGDDLEEEDDLTCEEQSVNENYEQGIMKTMKNANDPNRVK